LMPVADGRVDELYCFHETSSQPHGSYGEVTAISMNRCARGQS
jgi:hypothetical protein